MPDPPAPPRFKGIPLRVLIDRRENFLPHMMYRFFEVAVRQPEVRYYKEAEVIWQAVSDETWRQLEAYMEKLREYCQQIGRRLQQQSSWNIFSPDVRAVWRESWQFYHGDRSVWSDYWRIINYSGWYVNRLRNKFISDHNSKQPGLAPPLRRSDNLLHRLGALPSFRRERVVYFKGFEAIPGPSGFLEGELDHLKRRGGIRFDGIGISTDFAVVVDARSNIWPKDDEVLGIAALLPTGTESESQETDSGSHGSQETDRSTVYKPRFV
ncbi:BZ3500_MvSof-1268-A1-R1_Chr6-3g08793 [Microbotryum saponariae]|uniref:BZ3500_MvSof-1268-A1-R1_Chr6-3g08793 protein n=1 Tax=Microbotryum saponariae TaxID=289078 RepID=A0A2X0KLF7_9BASI|nr:BZ3500_MvSof-1268-A1-R1_Chr6-3g08793 [Microbotryum saponariae]SDA07394.1 BZ3501_MvSof-1269-A2-R1_Chr6-2g08496 [Microbotryum saponariae]